MTRFILRAGLLACAALLPGEAAAAFAAVYTHATVTVPANTATQLIGPNSERRVLILSPSVNTCVITFGNGPGAMPLGSGFVFDATTPPPQAAVTATCSGATTIFVTEGT